MLDIITVILYLVALYLIATTLSKKNGDANRGKSLAALAVVACGAVAHLATVYKSIATDEGYILSFFKMPSLFFVSVNIIVLLSCLSKPKPLRNLFLFLLPLSSIAVAMDTLSANTPEPTQYSSGVSLHVLLSVLAYSLLTIATVQALFLAYQNRQLKQKHLSGVVGILPPLQTMETLLFELLWAGQVLLSLSILSGVLFIDNLFSQHLVHKTTFSILSWIIYAMLLWGRHFMGWRGPAAIRWTLGGFAALMLAYFGSKLVLEIILNRS